MNEVTFGALRLVIDESGERTTLSFLGRSDDRNPSNTLNPFFDKFVNDLKGELNVDFKDLEFMNSSTVLPLLQFIKKLEKKGVKSFFFYSKDSRWQSVSFKALKTIADSLKNISIEAK